jgi:PAS domain-containing protein
MLQRDLNCISSLAQRLAVVRSMEDFSHIITEEARRLLSADGVSFVLRDDQNCYYLDENAVSPLWRGLKFPMSACISGWCMLNMRTAVIADIYQDDRIPHEAYRPTFVKSLVMVPIGRPEPLAAMGVYWSNAGVCEPERVAMIEAISAIAASAITSISLYTFLLQAEQKLAIAHETGSLGTYQLNTETMHLSASPSMKQIFGGHADETFSYRQLLESIHENDRYRLIDAISKTTSSGRPFSLDCRIAHGDNSHHAIRILGRISYRNHDPDASIVGAVRYVRDITSSVDRRQ